MRHTFGLGLVLTAYLVIAGLFATRTPAWQAPDEPAHYNYVAQVANGTLIPVIAPGDWDNQYLETLKRERFHPDFLDNLAAVRYENHQPPLYYWLATPIFWLTNGSLTAIRFYSLLWGLITIFMAWRITQLVFPQCPHLALAAAAWAAFLPQHVAILASVNNDALAGALIATTLYATLRYVRGDAIKPFLLGGLIGLIFITKTTGYFMAGVVLLALFLRQFTQPNKIPFRALIEFGIPASMFALCWWGRNIAVYGFPDFLGLRAHDSIVIGQLRTQDYIAQIGQSAYWEQFFTTTFNSFWGQFGWMGVPLYDVPTPGANILYPAFLGLVLVALVGLAPGIRVNRGNQREKIKETHLILIAVLLLTVLMFLYYNSVFVQFQGRYLFTGLIPLVVYGVYGLDAWRRLLLARFSWAKHLILLPMIGLALLDLYLIWRVIPGALAYV